MTPSVGLGFAAASRLPKKDKDIVINRGRGDFHTPPFEATLKSDDSREIRRVTYPTEPLQPNRHSAGGKDFNKDVKKDFNKDINKASNKDFKKDFNKDINKTSNKDFNKDFNGARRLTRAAIYAANPFIGAPAAAAAMPCRRSKKSAAGAQKKNPIVVTFENPKSVQQQQQQPKKKSFSSRGGAKGGMAKAPMVITITRGQQVMAEEYYGGWPVEYGGW